jgi:hypothetical protein
LQAAVEHRLGEVPLELAFGGDRNSGDAKRRLTSINAREELLDRGFNEELRSDVYLLGDFLPQLDAEAGEPAILLETKGRTCRVATRTFSPFGCARAAQAKRQRKSASMGVFIVVVLAVGLANERGCQF